MIRSLQIRNLINLTTRSISTQSTTTKNSIQKTINLKPSRPSTSRTKTEQEPDKRINKKADDDQELQTKIYGVTYVPPLQITRSHTKRADYGLYDGLKVKSGDQVSKSKNRSRRVWKPNVQVSKLWSEILGQSIQLRVTTSALKSIDQLGGLDRYILQSSDKKLGGTGMRIRSIMISAMKEKVKLSKAFTRPIPRDDLWRIPQFQDSTERSDRSTVRKMVTSRDFNEVRVFPRRIDDTEKILKDFESRDWNGSQIVRRSTHPRR